MADPQKLKAVVAGCGWGEVHARGFNASEHATLEALWSRSDKPAARQLADRMGVPLYTDYTKMLDEVDPDLVGVAVPEAGHEALTCEALEHGCHVYCEKVLSDSLPAAKRMVAKAKETGRQLMVGYNYRYSDSCMYLADLVSSGKLGQPLFAQLRAFSCCIHHMTDYVNSLLGTPTRVVAVMERQPLAGRPHTAPPELVFETFVYSSLTQKVYMVAYESGAVLQAASTDYTSAQEPGATLLVQGSEGRVELNDLSGEVRFYPGGRESTVFAPSQICDDLGLKNNGIKAICDFARVIAMQQSVAITGEAGVKMIQLEEAIARSAESGQWETIDTHRV